MPIEPPIRPTPAMTIDLSARKRPDLGGIDEDTGDERRDDISEFVHLAPRLFVDMYILTSILEN